MNLEEILTETQNPQTTHIDSLTTLDILKLINQEDATVAQSVKAILPEIARAVDWVAAALKQGGRLIYIGAGTSGRLGVLDAAECPPTYGTYPDQIIGLIAGGRQAMFRAVEGAEDSPSLAADDLDKQHLTADDIVVGIAASGRTPYVLGGLKYAKQVGCRTIGLTCSFPSAISEIADLTLSVLTGPEVITGSTRMKAGTAQKLVLNMLTTAAMILLGKVYGNLMVDLQATNEKLKNRSRRIVALATGAAESEVIQSLTAAGGSAKLAIVMLLTHRPADQAKELLQEAGGFISQTLSSHKN